MYHILEGFAEELNLDSPKAIAESKMHVNNLR